MDKALLVELYKAVNQPMDLPIDQVEEEEMEEDLLEQKAQQQKAQQRRRRI